MKKTFVTGLVSLLTAISLPTAAAEKPKYILSYSADNEKTTFTITYSPTQFTTFIESKKDDDLIVDKIVYSNGEKTETLNMHTLDKVMEKPKQFANKMQTLYRTRLVEYAAKNPVEYMKFGYKLKDVPAVATGVMAKD